MLVVKRIINTPVPSNCFVVYDKSENTNCIIVDPGTKDNEELIAYISEQELSPVYIILTHEHFDHCWGVNSFVKRYDVPILCSERCIECIKYDKKNCSVFYDINERFTIDSKSISVESLDYVLPFAGTRLQFFNTPGHSEASVCFTIGRHLFAGDTLIKDLRTVTKLPTGSVVKLRKTIDFLKQMQGKGYVVCPGHGEIFELDGYNLELMEEGDIPI